MITAGIDIGTYAVKVILLNGNNRISQSATPCGNNPAEHVVRVAINRALDEARLSPEDITFTVGTGTQCREISYVDEFASQAMCLAKGCYEVSKSITTIVDIGMLDTLVVKMKSGIPTKAASNDKCASCSGMFIEMLSKSLKIDIEDMAEVSLRATKPVEITSTCAVFAESEIISLIYLGNKVEDILKGAFIALARRTYPLLLNVGFERKVCMVGGVANNRGIVRAMEQQLESPVIVPKFPEMIAALGAALLAQKRA